MELRGHQTQFYIDIIYGLGFASGFGYLLFVGMDPLVAAFQGGLVFGYILRVWENMSVYERILQEEVAAEAEAAVATEAEVAVAEEVEEAVADEAADRVAEEIADRMPDEVAAEVEKQVAEQMADEVRDEVDDRLDDRLDEEIDERGSDEDEARIDEHTTKERNGEEVERSG